MSALHKIGLAGVLKRGAELMRSLNLPANEKGLNRFERFWRPVFGYAVSLTWVLHMLTVCYVVWSDNPRAPEIIMALVETTSLWSVALAVLGLSVVKGVFPQQGILKSRAQNENLIFYERKNDGRNIQSPKSSTAGYSRCRYRSGSKKAC